MNNLKSFSDYNKVNEELTFFGMDVVMTLSEYLGIWATIVFIAVFGTAFGFMSLKDWLLDIKKVRRKINIIKKLINIIEKYKDDVVDDYIHDFQTMLHNVKTKNTRTTIINGISVSNMTNYKYQKAAEKLTKHLESKMTKEDYDAYKNILENL